MLAYKRMSRSSPRLFPASTLSSLARNSFEYQTPSLPLLQDLYTPVLPHDPNPILAFALHHFGTDKALARIPKSTVAANHLPSTHPFSWTMCQTQSWRGYPCLHQWVTLETPCAEGKHFSNCKSFEDRHARSPRAIHRAPAGACPRCDKKDDYDGDKIRMVKVVKRGTKFGTGPGREKPGVECTGGCIVM